MQNKTSLYISAQGLITFALLGALIGYAVGFGVSIFASRGTFSSWKLISSPMRFSRIVGANPQSIWAESNGQMYVYDISCSFFSRDCKEWILSEKVPPNSANIQKGEKCPAWSPHPKNTPPGDLRVCALSDQAYGEFAYYALLQDGTIWYWKVPGRNSLNKQKKLFAIAGILISMIVNVVLRRHPSDQYEQIVEDAKALISKTIASVFTGSSIGLLLAIVFLIFYEYGFFTFWQSMESSVNFASIVDANIDTVWVKSVDNKVYSWDSNCYGNVDCNQWIELRALPENMHDDLINTIKETSCPFEGSYYPKTMPRNVIECVLVKSGMYESSWTVYYALMEDGTIQRWKFTSNGYNIILFPLVGIIAGAIVGVVAGIASFIMLKRKKKIVLPSSDKATQLTLFLLVGGVGYLIGNFAQYVFYSIYRTGLFSSWAILDGLGRLKIIPAIVCPPAGVVLGIVFFIMLQKRKRTRL